MKILPKQLRNNFPLLFVVLLVGLWFRMQSLINETFAFTYDVGRDMLALHHIVVTHKLPLIGATTGLQGLFYGPTWYYFLTPFFILFNGNPKGILFLMVLCGISTALTGYFFGKEAGGKSLGLIIATLISLSPILIGISSQIWNPNPIPLFIMAAFYIIFAKIFGVERSVVLWSFVLGLILGIIFDLEIVFGTLFLISTITFLLVSRIYIKQKSALPVLAGGFLVVQLPRLVFELRHSFLMTDKFLSSMVSPTSASLFTTHANFYRAFKVIFGLWTDTLNGQFFILGLLSLAFVAICILKGFRKSDKKEKNILLYCCVVLFTYFIGFSFFNHDIESHYYVGLPVVLILIFGFSVHYASKYMKIRYIGIYAIAFFLLANIKHLNLIETFHKSTWRGDASVYKNQLQVVDYIYKDAKGQPFNYITYTPPIFDYPYQYIFQYTGKNKYGYLPDTKHQQLFYLILEPDLQIPARQLEWLAVREGDGKVVGGKTFGSGIRVEKRIH